MSQAVAKQFFVSVKKYEDDTDYRILLGPYDDHETALGNVQHGRQLANEVDPKSAFYAFGTFSAPVEIAAKLKPIFKQDGEFN